MRIVVNKNVHFQSRSFSSPLARRQPGANEIRLFAGGPDDGAFFARWMSRGTTAWNELDAPSHSVSSQRTPEHVTQTTRGLQHVASAHSSASDAALGDVSAFRISSLLTGKNFASPTLDKNPKSWRVKHVEVISSGVYNPSFSPMKRLTRFLANSQTKSLGSANVAGENVHHVTSRHQSTHTYDDASNRPGPASSPKMGEERRRP